MIVNKKRFNRFSQMTTDKKRFKKILIRGKDSKDSHKRERFSQMIINKNMSVQITWEGGTRQ